MAKEDQNMRKSLVWFAGRMERELRRHSDKGGWSHTSYDNMQNRLRGHLDELSEAIVTVQMDPIDGRHKECFEKIIHEAADTANLCFIIADLAKRGNVR